jgi:phage tail sheath protein FI
LNTDPGVHVEEISNGPRRIAGVPTSNAAFVDWFARGPMNVATPVTSWTDFERMFGGLDASSAASWHIRQFFLNGGGRAWIVRIGFGNVTAGAIQLQNAGQSALSLTAASPGSWGQRLYAAVA